MSRAIAVTVLLAGLLTTETAAAAGFDQVYEKPADRKFWGQQVADLVGIGVYRKSYALVVGISQYTTGYKLLPTERDALRMRDYLLHEAGFDYVHVLTEEQVTPQRVNSVMLDELRPLIDSNDRFLFYWSGHGTDLPNIRGGYDGYLPVADSRPDAYGSMVSMSDLQRWDNVLPAEQTLFLLDACFSGLAGAASMAPAKSLALSQLAKPSRHIISAGFGTQETIAGDQWDGSLFTHAILEGLRGAADTRSAYPPDGVVSLNELIAYVKLNVEDEKQRVGWDEEITPQLRDLRTNQGEFFFVTRATRTEKARRRGEQPTGEFAYGEPVVRKGTVVGDQTPVPAGLVAKAQEILLALGYAPGPADGVLGIRTRRALRAFQRDRGLAQTGELGAVTQDALESAWAERSGPGSVTKPTDVAAAPTVPSVRTAPAPQDIEPEMVRLPGGTFQMGSPTTGREGPVRTVRVPPFAIGRFEVTFDEYDAFARATERELPDDKGWGRGSRPVINVSWYDAKAYARWLSEQTGKRYRLPTEVEWEYAARAEASTRWSFGDDEEKLAEHAWFGRNSGLRTREVGTRKPNQWGLHDVHGNVWEWVEDCSLYWMDPPPDIDECALRLLRGGSSLNDPWNVRSASRLGDIEPRSRSDAGFRLARDL